MRLTRFVMRAAVLAGAAALLLAPVPAGKAAPQQGILRPEESEARARELLQATIGALGGQTFLNVRDITCEGRFAQFGTQGDLAGYIKFYDYTKLPDKNRTEFTDKRNIVFVNNGDQGWDLDKGGVTDAPADRIERFEESLKKDIGHLLRHRLNHEEGLVFRYDGTDIVDLKQVDWVEVADRERRTIRIALDKKSRLPIRAVYQTRDPATRRRVEEVEFFSNYHRLQGVETPFQVARERNGQKVYQVFYRSCQYNTGLQDSFFTREALEQHFGQFNKGKKKK